MVKHIDTAQRETVYAYDKLYRLKSETNTLNQRTTYAYGQVSRHSSDLMRVKVKDAAGQTYFLEYDAMGRLVAKVRGDWKESYEYDAVGESVQADELRQTSNKLYVRQVKPIDADRLSLE